MTAPTITEVVLTTSGEFIDPTDPVALRDAYQAVKDIEAKCAEDRHAIASAFREHHALPALSNTVHVPGGKVVVEGGPTLKLDANGLRGSLMTLASDEDSPITRDQVDAAFTSRVSYSPHKVKWDKFLELGGPTVRQLVDQATQPRESPYRLSISADSE